MRALALAAALLFPIIAAAQTPPRVGPLYSLDGANASGANVTVPGGVPRTAGDRAADVFNIADGYGGISGAICDGSTNDDAAVNATLTAAFNSNAYQNNNAVVVTGPSGVGRGCVINQLNLTQFTKGTGANTRARLTLRDLRFLCTGAGNVCLDALGADFVAFDRTTVRGDGAPNTPEMCLQVGVISGVSAAWNTTNGLSCNNEFTFTALYNMGSEANTYTNSFFVNSHNTSGPIGVLGSITAGSGYTSGTYTNIALLGGTGSGALATVTASGGIVTAVVVSYEGRNYVAGDVLTPATFGGGTGFSVPITSTKSFAAVVDGQNHWRAHSSFVTETVPVDTWQSLTLVSFVNSHVRQLVNNGGALWASWTSGMNFKGYILNVSTASNGACIDLYNSGVTKGGIPDQNGSLRIDMSCEGAAPYGINLTGPNNTPSVFDMTLIAGGLPTNAVFGSDPNITSVTLNNVDLDIGYEATAGLSMFSSAKIWNVTGRARFTTASTWNAPNTFQGNLIARGVATPPALGPVDILAGAAQAVSCARQLSNSYTGALCQLHRASDSTNLDIYPASSGSIDRNAVTAFCNGTTCTVAIMYDQSGNGNNFTQTTVVSQPTYTPSVAALGGRPALLFGDASAIAMSATAAASINDIFATGGYASVVYDQTVVAGAADRILYKGNGGTPGIGFDYRLNNGGQSQTFKFGVAITAGTWATVSPGSFGIGVGVGMVDDIQYSFASNANVPVIGFNSNVATFSSSTQPIGTATTDAAFPLLLGNNALTGGANGFPGYIAESVIWKATPTAAQLEAIRRNQAVFYGVANVN